MVTCKRDPHGSHGFCLLNNIAIAGAYAVNRYRHEGVPHSWDVDVQTIGFVGFCHIRPCES